MTLPGSPGPEHDAFIAWAQDRGVSINGIAPARLPGRGLGVVATREVKEGDVLVSVPAKALLTIESKHVKDAGLPAGEDATVHGRLAAYLTMMDAEGEVEWDVWRRVWPTRESFEDSMPLCWDEREKKCLSAPGRDHLAKQEAKLEADWNLLRNHLPDPSDRGLYTYYWMIVNTRTFFWDYPTSHASKPRPKKRKLAPDDCMALCPFMEYFNHADEGCEVDHSKAGFTITSHRTYKPGEEIHVSYGAHTNEFLLVEYGFVLDANKWDDVRLDPVILPRLDAAQTAVLRDNGFLGDYAATRGGECCHRTQVALRALLLPKGRVEGFLRGLESGEREQKQVDVLLGECAGEYLKVVEEMEEKVRRLDEGERKSVLQKRWGQVKDVLEALTESLEK